MTTTDRAVRNENLTAYARIQIGGAEVPQKFRSNLRSAVVEQSLHQPSMFVLRFYEPDPIKMELIDDALLEIGKEVTVALSQDPSALPVIKGEITAIELDIDAETGMRVILVRGYDKMHRLHRGRHIRTFLQKTDGDILKQVAQEAGLAANAEATQIVYNYIIQNNETDYEFLKRRAIRIGMELYYNDDKLKLRKSPAEAPEVAELEWGKNLQHLTTRLSSHPHADEVTVRGWDPKTKKEIVGTAKSSNLKPKIGVSEKKPFGSAKVAVVYRPVTNQSEAEKNAQALLDELQGQAIEMEGNCLGDPKLKPGAAVKIKNVGTKYSGKYYLTKCEHVYNTRNGSYMTRFEATGRQINNFLELTTQSSNGQVGVVNGPVIGVVTNLKDPDNLGRVKVKFPWLSDKEESDWARIASPMAGKDRGFFFLPEVNDEVLVVFEQGDMTRPFILGALWNGKDKPPKKNSEVLAGSGAVNQRILKTTSGHTVTFDDSSDKPGIEIIDKTGKNKIVITSTDNKITIEAQGDIDVKSATGNINMKATKNVTIEGMQIEIKGQTSSKMSATQVEVNGTATTKVTAATVEVNGSAMTQIKGGMVKLN